MKKGGCDVRTQMLWAVEDGLSSEFSLRGNRAIMQLAADDFPSQLILTPHGYTVHEGFQKEFDRIADLLLNKCVLTVNETTFRFVEIEFYYNVCCGYWSSSVAQINCFRS
jgi:hypothetical protein